MYAAVMDAPSAVMVMAKGRQETNLGNIAFTVGESSLAVVLAARSENGICAILIGSDAEELESDLAGRFPDSMIVRNGRELESDLRKILRFIENPSVGLDLPLEVHGTEFQRRVWDALCAVPAGRAVTYAALARRIGEPKAVRAVANACAANAIALAIPCHRVIRSDGTLSGYRWGVERQRALLEREARAAA